MTRNYREAYGLFACNGIAFNHESERRGYEVVTRKITSTVAAIAHGLADELCIGNLGARRDWRYSPDYVRGIWLMLQQEHSNDYVLATGETHSVRELVQVAFEEAGLDWEEYVVTDPQFFRPAEVHELRGDPSKAQRELGWEPEIGLKELAQIMVRNDLEFARIRQPVLSKG